MDNFHFLKANFSFTFQSSKILNATENYLIKEPSSVIPFFSIESVLIVIQFIISGP